MGTRTAMRASLLAGSILGAASQMAVAGPNYQLLTTIDVPTTAANTQPGGAMTAFDISFADTTGFYYLADRSNASIDVINGSNLGAGVINQIGGFAGQQSTTSTSGPDGVLVAHIGGNAILFGGDAGSTLRSFNVNNPASAVTLSTLNTGGSFRVDEMAFSPSANLVMVANNADSPAFATLVNANQPLSTHAGNITISGQPATGGMEQSVWDPHTNSFFVSVPVLTGAANDPGGLAEINTNGTVIRTISFSALGIAACSPTGLALGGSGNLMVGCGTAGTQTLVVNPTTGLLVSKISSVSGSDELWYDPVTGNFYVTGVDAAGHRVISVINDALDSVLQDIDLTALGADSVNAHSVAVDPLNGDIFVPLEGSTGTSVNTLCPLGCVAVFAAAAPEPGSLPVLVVGLAGLIGLGVARARRS